MVDSSTHRLGKEGVRQALLRLLDWSGPAFFLLPYLLLFVYLGRVHALDVDEIWWAVKNSTFQAFFSALFSLIFGLFLAVGLNRIDPISERWGHIARAVLLLPSLLPAFFVLLTTMTWIDPLPFGLIGITIVHVFQYSGMLGASLAGVLAQRLGSVAEISYCLGAGRFQFYRAAWPLVRRDLLLHGIFVFLMSFSSFSIPLVIGGGRGTTLEILIYEKMRMNADIGAAVAMSLLQTAILGLLLWRVPQQLEIRIRRRSSLPLISSSLGSGLILGYAIFFLTPWILQAPLGFFHLKGIPDIWETLAMATGYSLFYAVNAAVFVFVGLLGISFLSEKASLVRFLRIYFPPSVALIGMAGIILSPFLTDPGSYLFCLVILFLPMVYRFGFETKLQSLRSQIQVAEILGASRVDIWKQLIVPQIWPQLSFLMGLAFVWSLGDFALGKFFLPSGATLPLVVENLMTSYRVHAAMAVGMLILILSALAMFVFRGVARVFD